MTKTAREIAAETLAAHAIRPEWRRTGDQIAALIAEAVEADRSQREPEVVVLARGEVLADDARVEVLDLDHVLGMTNRSEYAPEDIAGIATKLRRAGWESIADDVEEAYEDAEPAAHQ